MNLCISWCLPNVAQCVSKQHCIELCHRWLGALSCLWNNVYGRWITINFPCKWHRKASTATLDSPNGWKSSQWKISHRNSSGARTPTWNSEWTAKRKTSTRDPSGAERISLCPAKKKPLTRDRGQGLREVLRTGISSYEKDSIKLPQKLTQPRIKRINGYRQKQDIGRKGSTEINGKSTQTMCR